MCGELLNDDDELCDSCVKGLVPIDEPHCVVCGLKPIQCCCESFEAVFDRRRAPFVYTGPIKTGIIRMKFHNKPFVSRYLARKMAECVLAEYGEYRIDLVVCVPMRHIDIVKRGYNQSALLASQLAELLGLECDTAAIKKIKATKKQHELDAAERSVNLKNSFAASSRSAVAGKAVLLCDDVVTTGSTLNECARILLDAGASHVLCICAAATC